MERLWKQLRNVEYSSIIIDLLWQCWTILIDLMLLSIGCKVIVASLQTLRNQHSVLECCASHETYFWKKAEAPTLCVCVVCWMLY